MKSIQIEEAVEILADNVKTLRQTEYVPLYESCGRILAEDAVSENPQPPFARSPLDGYAMKAADLEGASKENPARLTVVGKIFAGSVYDGVIKQGQALRIMTGAPVPEGADTVVRQEDTRADGGIVEVYVSSKPYKNYCPAGEDYAAGSVLLEKGSLINAAKAAVLSSLGKTEICVYKKPRVSVITTGDEVVLPGRELLPGKIYDSNLAYISLRLAELGFAPVISKHSEDDVLKTADEIRAACAASDFVITTGGVSVGEKDIMHDVEKELEAEHLFWNVNIKPGRPTLAFKYNGTLVLCLSGNPYGAVVNFELLARPVLAKLSGNENLKIKPVKARLENDFGKKGGKRRFVRGDLKGHRVTVFEQPSGTVSTLAKSSCLVEIPAENDGLPAGAQVSVYKLTVNLY